jgi:SsrA-binding protein
MEIFNKKARYEYELFEHIEAGIQLYGGEVKAIKGGHADLTGSHVRIIGSEAYVVGAKVFPYEYARPDGYDSGRTRKLLLHKKEIIALKSKIDGQHLTIVPLRMYTVHGIVKLELALAKGKKQFDKRASLKRKAENRAKQYEYNQ